MAITSSGLIKFSDVQTEFGGTDPIKLSEYYGSDTVPSSGLIKMSDFYGTSAEKLIPTSAVLDNLYTITRTQTGGYPAPDLSVYEVTSQFNGILNFVYAFNRYSAVSYSYTISNLFNIAGISSADVGRSIQVWYERLTTYRDPDKHNEDDDRVYDNVGGKSVNYAANGFSASSSPGWMTASTLSASGNGSCTFNVSHAQGQPESQYSGNIAGGTTIQHILFDDGATANVFRIT